MRVASFALPSWLTEVLAALSKLAALFIAMGPLGAFLLALVDSFIPIPGGTDLAVVLLSAQAPSLAAVVVLGAAAGATLGSTVLYLGAHKAGDAALKRFSPE